MTRARSIIVAIAVAVVCGAGWYAFWFLYAWKHIPEAYAAWDTGSLLVAYMERHQDQWPASWDDLLAMIDASEEGIPLRSGATGDRERAHGMCEMVVINWAFDPAHPDAAVAVTPPGGGEFPVLWEDPNEMVRSYLARGARSRVSQDAE